MVGRPSRYLHSAKTKNARISMQDSEVKGSGWETLKKQNRGLSRKCTVPTKAWYPSPPPPLLVLMSRTTTLGRGSPRVHRTRWQFLARKSSKPSDHFLHSNEFLSHPRAASPFSPPFSLCGCELDGLESQLRTQPADDDGQVVRRAGGGAERLDLVPEELGKKIV